LSAPGNNLPCILYVDRMYALVDLAKCSRIQIITMVDFLRSPFSNICTINISRTTVQHMCNWKGIQVLTICLISKGLLFFDTPCIVSLFFWDTYPVVVNSMSVQICKDFYCSLYTGCPKKPENYWNHLLLKLNALPNSWT
jgi:hypothetical protein